MVYILFLHIFCTYSSKVIKKPKEKKTSRVNCGAHCMFVYQYTLSVYDFKISFCDTLEHQNFLFHFITFL